MDILIREETESDYRSVEELTREAFWNLNVPGCDEHYLAHSLRKSPAFIPELDLVAETDGKIVGNIMYAHSSIKQNDGSILPVLTFGPLSVLPEFQKKGIGGQLIRKSIAKAIAMGYSAILIYGDPAYYARFGFVAAEEFKIRTNQGLYAAALQAYELQPGALSGVSGKFDEGEAYQIDPELSAQFDKGFPFKEKLVTPSQSRFMELVRMVHE